MEESLDNSIWSIPWLLMPWWCREPGHYQPVLAGYCSLSTTWIKTLKTENMVNNLKLTYLITCCVENVCVWFKDHQSLFLKFLINNNHHHSSNVQLAKRWQIIVWINDSPVYFHNTKCNIDWKISLASLYMVCD